VMLTTHNLERGLGMCRRVALLIEGQIAHQMDEGDWDLDRFQEVYEERSGPRAAGTQHAPYPIRTEDGRLG
jgi:ABC-type multidrug transport system ATPase subunit